MTRRTNARIAGVTFLAYIALGIPSMVLSGRATHGEGTAAKFASIAQHTSDVRIAVLLTLLCTFCALVLGVTMYAITRDQDRDLAMLACAFRIGEGVLGGSSIPATLGLLWLATATGPEAPDSQSAQALGAYLLKGQGASASFLPLGACCSAGSSCAAG